MIIAKTPFRMSFFGGGTDFPGFYKQYGGSVISTTFDKYCYVNVRNLPGFFNYSNQIIYSRIENTKDIEEIEHPLVREAMKYLKMQQLRVSYDADLPARSGLGTSSAFAVGLLNSFYALKGQYVDKYQLANEAIYLERVLCNESGGIQDQIATSFGGLNRIDFSSDGYKVSPIIISEERKRILNSNLMLFFTGFSRFSSHISKSQERASKEKIKELLELLSLVDEAEKILTSRCDINQFGELLDYTWQIKKGITNDISNDIIDETYKLAIDAGAIGGKLLGAGGGGFLLFYVEQDKQEDVKEALDNLLHVPFKFEDSGTQILYYRQENYNYSVPLRDNERDKLKLII